MNEACTRSGLSWDGKYLGLAAHVASWSKDPSTKVGAAIVSPANRVVGIGYNGFPVGVRDGRERLEDRPTKYKFVVHAEANAILNSGVARLDGCTLYTTLSPCCECAKLVIQSGVKRVVYGTLRKDEVTEQMFKEAGVSMESLEELYEGL